MLMNPFLEGLPQRTSLWLTGVLLVCCFPVSGNADANADANGTQQDSVAARQTPEKTLPPPAEYLSCEQAGNMRYCIKGVSLHHKNSQLTARLRVDVSRGGRSPHNEFLIWTDCGTAQFRVLSREPIRLPTHQRWRSIRANTQSVFHQTLRTFSTLACVTAV